MIRDHLQHLKDAIAGQVTRTIQHLNNRATESLDIQFSNIINDIVKPLDTIELNDNERKQLQDACSTKDRHKLEIAVHDVQIQFYNRIIDTTVPLATERIYRIRLLALFFNRITYSNYIAKANIFFEALGNLARQLSTILVNEEVKKLTKAFEEMEKAKTEYNAFGPLLEE